MSRDTATRQGALVIYGAWYYGRVIAEAAGLCKWEVAGFVDPDPPEGTPTLAEYPAHAEAIVAIGDNQLRASVTGKLLETGRKLVSVIHPAACVSPSAVVADGCFLAEYAVVRTGSSLGMGTFVNSGAVVSHDCRVGSFVTFGPNAASASHVSIGDRSLIGVGASIRPLCTIGNGCRVGAGAAVIRDVPDHLTVGGVPASPLTCGSTAQKQSDWSSNTVW